MRKKLPEDVVMFFRNQDFVIVSTVGQDGSIHNSCKGIVRISRDGRIYLMDLYLRGTFQNLKNNNNMSISAVDGHKFEGFCLKGKANAVAVNKLSSPIVKIWEAKITSRITNRILRNLKGDKGHESHPEQLLPKPEYMIVMDVQEIVNLTPMHLIQGVLK